MGNRQSLVSTLAALQSQAATFDANDRISGDTFDANGNTLGSGGIDYTYDFQDRLLTATGGISETYDGDGNRVSSTVAGVTTKFLVDEHTPTGYTQVAEELVGGMVMAQYTYGGQMSAWGRISQNRGGTVSYYAYDPGVSVRQLLGATGAVTDTYSYDAFGNTVARTGSTVNPFQYRGEQLDTTLGMYYLRARWYDSRTGRFLTQDKFEPPNRHCGCCAGSCQTTGCKSGGCALTNPQTINPSSIVGFNRFRPCPTPPNPSSLNHFLYASADPVNRSDPSGRLDQAYPLGITIAVIGTATFMAAANYEAQTHTISKIIEKIWKGIDRTLECADLCWQCIESCQSFFGATSASGGGPDFTNCIKQCGEPQCDCLTGGL